LEFELAELWEIREVLTIDHNARDDRQPVKYYPRRSNEIDQECKVLIYL